MFLNKFTKQLTRTGIMVIVLLIGAVSLPAQISVLSSHTIDNSFVDSAGIAHGANNGKLNAIRIKTDTELNEDFSGFTVSVPGYTVNGYYLDSPKKDIFVLLEEGSLPDTGNTPRFTIRNTTLGDAATGRWLLRVNGSTTPDDKANPVIAYTLAVAGQKEVFLRFSEEIRGTPSLWDSSGTIRHENLTASKTDLVKNFEFLYKRGRVFSVSEILNSSVRVGSTVKDVAGNFLTNSRHRLTNLVLGTPGDEIILPTTAKPASSASGDSSSVVDIFDGTKTVEATSVLFSVSTRQNAVYAGVNPASDIELLYAFNVHGIYRNKQGLWLPPLADKSNPAPGLVSRTYGFLNPTRPASPQAGSRIQQYSVTSYRSALDGTEMDFFFRVKGNRLVAKIPDATVSDWYRRVSPWKLKIQQPYSKQVGGVSILGNVVNVAKGDKTAVVYSMGSGGVVTIQVLDLSGKVVKILQNGTKSTGTHRAAWDGKNSNGESVARGIYFIRIVGPDELDQIRKVLVVK